MAKIKYDSVNGLVHTFEVLSEIPEETVAGILARQAELILQAVRTEANRLRPGYDGLARKAKRQARGRAGYSTGQTAQSVTVSSPEVDQKNELLKVDVYFSGTRRNGPRKRKANAAIAFFNEFGTRNNPTRNFVRKAVASVDSAVTEIARQGIDAWLKKNNL